MYFVSMIISWISGEKFRVKQMLFLVVTDSSVGELYNTRKSSRKEGSTKLTLQSKGELLDNLIRQQVKIRMTDIQSLWKCL